MQTATPSQPEFVERSCDLLEPKDAAEILKTKPDTLSVWRSTGRYAIPFVKVGRLVRYRRGDLEAWLASRTRSSGATE